MTDRPRIAIPFGAGIDRESGAMLVDRSTFRDLRNTNLQRGRLQLRQGLGLQATLDAGWQIINVQAVRSRSLSAILVLDPISTDFKLYIAQADGTGAVEKAHFVGSAVPGNRRFILADAYDKLFIAHDEPNIFNRAVTLYWDFRSDSIGSVVIGGDQAYFRGVDVHLSYLLGWGFGVASDPDRPETLRISLPGQPNVFDPQHYFLVGIRGDPITGGGNTGSTWAIKKAAQGHTLIGSDRATFGVHPLEDHIGLPRQPLGVSVNGVYYFWDANGPRRESGGQSEDISPGLALLDLPPDTLAVIDTDTGFAVYDPTHREVLFVFGRWAFVYHLDAPERWSYNLYGVALGTGAVLYESSTGPLANPPDPLFVATLHAVAVPADYPSDSSVNVTVDFSGPHSGTEVLEIWVHSSPDAAWGTWRRFSTQVIGGAASITHLITGVTADASAFPYIPAGIHTDIAIRVLRTGIAQPGSTSADPSTWTPTAHHSSGLLAPLSAPVVGATSFPAPHVLEVDTTAHAHGTDVGGVNINDYMTFGAEIADGAGGWISLAAHILVASPGADFVTLDLATYAGLTRDVRVWYITPYATSAKTTIAGVVVPP